jgi:glycosyltransferase involved in cell wall biosynthesis
MVSVLTLTYKRPHLLEEAIESFLQQKDAYLPAEMVIINDNPEVDYVFDHANVRIINHKERFPSIASKLQWGFTQCNYDVIYRLDDDDLLTPWALHNVQKDLINHPGFDVYRSGGMYLFSENKYEGMSSNVNNGNVYTKPYLARIKFPDTSIGEDADITFHKGGTIYESKLQPTMIYRWGMNTLHISGMGNVSNKEVMDRADLVLDNRKGTIELHPKFLNDYYGAISKID